MTPTENTLLSSIDNTKDAIRNSSAIQEFCTWVDSYLNFEKTPVKNIFWLDTMEFLCEKLGNPQNETFNFHVAGSKGKGSISKMIACILHEAGFKTGIYSSPHILNFDERVQNPEGPFSDQIYAASFKQLKETIDSTPIDQFPAERPITWFELVTAFAMLCYRNAGCTHAVYEVGLGGRLDATNVIKSNCCVIGPIEKEHTEFLGDTVEKIAAEKAGIIKEKIPVFVANQKRSVKKVFMKIAKEKNAPITFAGGFGNNEVRISRQKYRIDSNNNAVMEFTLKSKLFSKPLHFSTRLLGTFQAQNAALAALAVKSAIPQIDESCIEKGIDKAYLEGRFEVIEKNGRKIILDGAHTVNSIKFTLDTYYRLWNEKPDLLYACAKDKDVEDIAMLFKGKVNEIHLTLPGSVKEGDLNRTVKAFLKLNMDFEADQDYIKVIRNCLEEETTVASNQGSVSESDKNACTKNKRPLLVTGSFYLLAEVKKILAESEQA